MNILLIILGALLCILFFLNIKNAADVLCRIIGGFALLYLYNMLAPMFGFNAVGINLLSAIIAGGMGIPGGILLLCAAIYL